MSYKIINWLKKHSVLAGYLTIILIIAIVIFAVNISTNISFEGITNWGKKSIKEATILDILIVAMIHAIINRSDK